MGSKSLNLALLRPKLPPGILTPQDSFALQNVGRFRVNSKTLRVISCFTRARWHIRDQRLTFEAVALPYGTMQSLGNIGASELLLADVFCRSACHCWAMLQYVYICISLSQTSLLELGDVRKSLTDDCNKDVLPMLEKVLNRLQPSTSNEDVPWLRALRSSVSFGCNPLARHRSSSRKHSSWWNPCVFPRPGPGAANGRCEP